MLIEISSNAFKSHNEIRPKITFKKSLNVVKGPDSCDNSIGKSDFLMTIDFAFGGNDYANKLAEVLRNVVDHTINFTFMFSEELFYFSRSISNPETVQLCNSNYEESIEVFSIKDYCNWLKEKNLIANDLSFREMISRYLRVYNRENGDECTPLKTFKNEKPSDAIIKTIKLFNLYSEIHDVLEKSKLTTSKKDAFTSTQNYQYIPKISKEKYNENLIQINSLNEEKQNLADKASKNLLELNSEKANFLLECKSQLAVYKRQRGKYYNQLDIIKKNQETKNVSQHDFTALQKFFPSVNIAALKDIELFHKSISGILATNFKDAESKAWNLINLLNMQIKNIESKLQEIQSTSSLSKIVLEKYSQIDIEIQKLKDENEKYDLLDNLKIENQEIKSSLKENQEEIQTRLKIILNDEMKTLNSFIDENNTNNPEIDFKSTSSYTFSTYNDGGTGTNYKGLIIFDLACLKLTDIPLLIHDSFLLKNIENKTIEKILELYLLSEKQIFIAFDNSSSYSERTQEIINSNVVINLSLGGNELYGFKW